MAGLPQTFDQHVRSRAARKSLAEGQASINDRIREFADKKRSSPNVREMTAMDEQGDRLDRQAASLDQGSRGASASETPPAPSANDALRDMFRVGKEREQ
jgi:hypothetical protein